MRWPKWGIAVSVFVPFAITAGMLALAAPVAGADRQPAPDDGLRPGAVVLVAGTGEDGYSGDGWDARKARIGLDVALTVAPNGLLYLTDRDHSRVRVVTADGKINTLPGTAVRGTDDRYPPKATAVGPDGALYIATLGSVERRQSDGTVTVIAGQGDESFGDGGPATEADISLLRDIVVDAAGSIYVADGHDKRIRKITPDGTITTVAGGGTRTPAQAEGGPATQLTLTDPKGLVAPESLAVDSAGNLYFSLSEGSLVGKVSPDGTFHTVVGNDDAPDGPAEQAQVGGRLGGLAVDRADNLYVSDGAFGLIRMITPDGTVSAVGPATGGGDLAVGPDGDLYTAGSATVHRLVRHGEPAQGRQPVRRTSPWAGRAPGTVVTVAGTGHEPSPLDTTVPPQFGHKPGPGQVAVGPDGTVYYADPSRYHVGTVTEDGRTTPIAGTGDGSGADQGPALRATLEEPGGVAVGPDGTVYIAERGRHRIRKVAPDGNIATVADIDATGLAVDAAGNLVVSDWTRIQRIDSAGTVSTLAGGGDRWRDTEGKPALEANLSEPAAVTVAADGTVYFVEARQAIVQAVGVDGILRTVAGDGGYYRDGGFAGDGGPATAAILNKPGGLAAGPDGALYIADTFNHRIRRVGPDGVITTFAGTGEPAEKGDGGPASTAALLEPTGLAFDRAGNLYVADPSGGSIRRIDTAGTITTIARFGDRAAGDRKATVTPLDFPEGVAVDRAGTLYVSAGATYAVGRDGTLGRLDGVQSGTLATGPDGSLYVSDHRGLSRRYPDGAIMGLVAASGSVRPPFEPGQLAITAQILGVTDVAVDPDGMVYLADGHNVYRIDRDGVITTVVRHGATGIAIGPDGSLYLAVSGIDRVLRFARGELTRFAGTGLGYALDGDDGEGGPATEAVVRSPKDVEVAPDGTAYLSTPDGIRRVSTDGRIDTILPAAQHPDRPDDSHPPGALALDEHGNLYFTEQGANRVRLLVRPGEIVIQTFGWRTMWLGLNFAVAVCVGVVVVVAYRRRLLALLTEWRDSRHPPPGWLLDR